MVDDLAECAKGSLSMCIAEAERFKAPFVRRYFHRWTEPAVGRCDCGSEVVLHGFTNTCRCGRDYNWSGQLLAPRSQWGEETGEHPADIARIP